MRRRTALVHVGSLDCEDRPQHFKRSGDCHEWGEWRKVRGWEGWHGDYRRDCLRCGAKEYEEAHTRME